MTQLQAAAVVWVMTTPESSTLRSEATAARPPSTSTCTIAVSFFFHAWALLGSGSGRVRGRRSTVSVTPGGTVSRSMVRLAVGPPLGQPATNAWSPSGPLIESAPVKTPPEPESALCGPIGPDTGMDVRVAGTGPPARVTVRRAGTLEALKGRPASGEVQVSVRLSESHAPPSVVARQLWYG